MLLTKGALYHQLSTFSVNSTHCACFCVYYFIRLGLTLITTEEFDVLISVFTNISSLFIIFVTIFEFAVAKSLKCFAVLMSIDYASS